MPAVAAVREDEVAVVGKEAPAAANRYIPALDGIRGFGILFVLLFHYAVIADSPVADHPIMTTGWVWLQMFFVQSGYLITGILLGMKHLPLKDYLKRFYWRRAM